MSSQVHKLLITLIAITAVLSAASCSSVKKDKENAQFSTRISSSNLKHFELRIGRGRQGDQAQGSARPSRQNNRPQRNPAREYKNRSKQMRKVAAAIIEENNYCREDFWVLDFDTDTRGNYLRGECYDLATPADRERFPDSIKNW